MNARVVLVLRGVIGLALVGSVGVQVLLGFQLWLERGEDRADLRIPLVALLGMGVLALHVIGVESWRLLTGAVSILTRHSGAPRYAVPLNNVVDIILLVSVKSTFLYYTNLLSPQKLLPLLPTAGGRSRLAARQWSGLR